MSYKRDVMIVSKALFIFSSILIFVGICLGAKLHILYSK